MKRDGFAMEDKRHLIAKMQWLLGALRDAGIVMVRPSIGREEVTYPDVQKLTGLDAREIQELLRYLVSENMLVSEPAESFFTCHNCDSVKMLYKLRCPICTNSCLKTGRAIEHMHCGHIDMEERFSGPTGFKCPNCKKMLKAIGVDYRSVGKYYDCLACKQIHPTAEQIFHCLNCGATAKVEDSNITVYNAYSLNLEQAEKITRYTMDLSLIAKALGVYGFETEFNSNILGKSGVFHRLDVVAYDKEKNVSEEKPRPDITASIIISNDEVNELSIMNFIAKIVDIESRNNIFAVIPKVGEPARKLANFYGIRIVESETTAILLKKMANEMGAIAASYRRNSGKYASDKLKEDHQGWMMFGSQ